MRSLKSGLFAIAFAGLFGAAAVVGCSADGGGSGIDQSAIDPSQPDPNAGTSGSVVPAKTPDGTQDDSGVKDAGKKDSGPKPEAGIDAGPPPPVEGDACTMPNTKASKSCGKCGKAETLCIAQDGGSTWGTYGMCLNEVAMGCVPGTTQPCGNCGTQTCSAFCGWGACTGQPAMACPAGSVDYTTASCATANTYRSRTCDATCQWGNYSGTCTAATTPNKMTVATALNGVVSAKWSLTGDTHRPDSCPGMTINSFDHGLYAVVEVVNPSATKTATITAYQSQSATGKANIDMVLWTYAGSSLPLNDAALLVCTHGVEDYCLGISQDVATNPCGNTSSNFYFAGTAGITIPPGQSILVYSSTYSSSTVVGDGTFNLNIKTTLLN
jgi:hypothetical protein